MENYQNIIDKIRNASDDELYNMLAQSVNEIFVSPEENPIVALSRALKGMMELHNRLEERVAKLEEAH